MNWRRTRTTATETIEHLQTEYLRRLQRKFKVTVRETEYGPDIIEMCPRLDFMQ